MRDAHGAEDGNPKASKKASAWKAARFRVECANGGASGTLVRIACLDVVNCTPRRISGVCFETGSKLSTASSWIWHLALGTVCWEKKAESLGVLGSGFPLL